MGFTHIEIMPITEYPFDGSWGYQPISLFAPTSRYGTPDDFRAFVEACHSAGLGVLLDWVPGHFPNDPHGLARFDGTALYEHADPRQGLHRDWNTLIYNYGRREVANFLLSSALYWLREFHIDGMRVDAVASMLYLDYSRPAGEWIPNAFGGRENLEAIAFLRRMNELVFGEGERRHHRGRGVDRLADGVAPDLCRRARLRLSNGTWAGCTTRCTTCRTTRSTAKYHHNDLTFGLLYAFHENFILPLSHDEVVHGKGSLIGKMPGDRWQRFANLRAYLAFMWTHPGKKLLFMGGEFAQEREWNHDIGLDWQLLGDPVASTACGGWCAISTASTATHRRCTSSIASPTASRGSTWRTRRKHRLLSAPRPRPARACRRRLQLHTGAARMTIGSACRGPGAIASASTPTRTDYGGSGVGNAGEVHAEPHPMHGHQHSVRLRLPPLGVADLHRGLGRRWRAPTKVWPGRPYPLGRDMGRRGRQFRAVFGSCREGRAVPVRSYRATTRRRASPCPNTPTRSGTAICRTPVRTCSTATASTDRTIPPNGHRFNPNKLLIDPYAEGAARQAAMERRASSATASASPREDLAFDRRDNARVMPKCRVIEPAFTWGDDRRPRISVGRDDHSRTACARLHHNAIPRSIPSIAAPSPASPRRR